MKKKSLFALFIMSFSVSPVFAQGQAVNADDILDARRPAVPKVQNEDPQGSAGDIQKSIGEAKAENADKAVLDKKVALAKEMHKVRSTRSQVDAAVQRASMMLPEVERAPFINVMGTMLNYNAIERISVDTMVDTYTLKELESMVEYYSKPEAKSANLKMATWAKQVQPEIARMIDRAIMKIKTGQ